MSERMNLASWSGVLGTWVSIAAAAGGGYMGLQTYNEEVSKMEDARVVQTFALYDMFSSEERFWRGNAFSTPQMAVPNLSDTISG